MINTKYGKFIDGKFNYAINPIISKTEMICNPTDEMYNELGYKPIEYTEPPQKEGCYYTSYFNENEIYISQEWEEHEMEEYDEFDSE